jgi:hypothetical protein
VHRHEYFDLRLHDDGELMELVGENIVERVTLHDWPLSCVQRLTLADGRKLVYKAQFGPTVEAEFYASARSDLLPWAETIYDSDGHVGMLIEFLEGPRVEELGLPEGKAVQIGRAVMEQIGGIAGERPHYLDVSDEGKWAALISAMLEDLRVLTEQAKFRLVDAETVRNLERRAFSEPVLSAIRTRPGYVHRDLSGDNVFLLPDGYRVIDWQRPILGPTDLDLAVLLESLGFDPLPHVGEGIVEVLDLLSVHWFTQCASTWFPEGATGYDRQIAELGARMRV